jgi:PST family polysaccharide transporter
MLLLARLLSPSDFGLIGMTTLFLGLINVISEFGIGTTIVVMTELTPRAIRQMHTVSLLLGLVGTAASVIAARPLAAFFRNAQLETVAPVMGLGFVLAGFRVVPHAVLLRDLRFKLASGIETAMTMGQAASSVILAWCGMRYWSIVIGGLLGNAIGSLLFCIYSPCGLAKPVLREMRGELTFGWRVLVSRAAWYLYSNADFAVAGRVLGNTALGIYNMAWNLANVPVDRFLALIFRVTPSILSKVQHDRQELRRYLGAITEGISLLSFPVGLGFALVAGQAVAVLFDGRWGGLVMPLRLLALYAVVRCVWLPAFQVQSVMRDVRFGMWQSLGMLAVLPPAFYYASRWGGTGIAAAWLILSPVLMVPALFRVLGRIGMRAGEYLAQLKPAALASMAMTAAVLGAHYVMHQVRASIQLATEAFIGVAVYAGILLVFFRPRIRAFVLLALRRRSEPAFGEPDA